MDTPEQAVNYQHNALGQRVAKLIDGQVVEQYLWQDLTTLLAVYDGQGNLKQRFEYTLGHTPNSFTQNGQRYFIQTDHLGSPRVITDNTGNVLRSLSYDSYGNIINDSNPDFDIPFGFAGGLYDTDTGLIRFGVRDYDPETGRWTARDPIGFAGGDTNLYGYVLGDPVNWIDPNGLQGEWFGYSASEWVSMGKTQQAMRQVQEAKSQSAQAMREEGVSFTLGVSASGQNGALGSSASYSLGFDTKGNICLIGTFCGRAGYGMSSGLTGVTSLGLGELCSGSSESVGLFVEGGAGKFDGVSYDFGRDNASLSASVKTGIGLGGASGGQVCHTRVTCF